MEPRYSKGDNVKIISTGSIGTVNDVLVRNDNVAYKVTVNGKTTTYPEKFLEPFVDEEQEILERLAFGEYGGIQDFNLFQTWYRLKKPIEGNLYSYLGSKTIFNPYQFKPLSKFISPGTDERLFIADEVGVGKTIETGIILTELIARGRLDHKAPILIVCPNSLGPKWVKEMGNRFGLKFHLHNGDSLGNALKLAANGVLPDSYLWSVVSIQILRHKKYMELLEKVNASRIMPLWKMVVVDEAHHMRNANTESNDLGNILSNQAEMMLMLSATPLNLKDEDLYNQMHILNPDVFPDIQTFNALINPVKAINRCRRLLLENTNIVYGDILNEINNLECSTSGSAILSHPIIKQMKEYIVRGVKMTESDIARFDNTLISLSPLDKSFTRSLKREALSHRVTREPVKVGVLLSAEEMNFYNDVIELAKDNYLSRGGNPAALGFITNMPRRMATSCIPAMKVYLKWCIDNDKIIMDKPNTIDEPDDEGDLQTTTLDEHIKMQFMHLYKQADRLEDNDTKYIEFSKLIKQLRKNLDNPQIIVFSFFVRTLAYLKHKLESEGYRVGLICGDTPVEYDGYQMGRYDIIEAFENKELDILLSSEVGGEGLDFQFCQAIVNYDMPYNPMRIEQRAGRIDRFGQKADKVIIASMFIKNTVDEDIYMALYDRISLVQDSVGDMEPILETKIINLQNEIISGKLSKIQLEERLKEIELAKQKAKLELEKFEANRNELMGDDYFNKTISNIEKGDFVHPQDAIRLTRICLSNWPGCSYEAIDEDRGIITLSQDIIHKLELFSRKPAFAGCMNELKSFLTKKFPHNVVFNGSSAVNYSEYIFLPPCGFWTKFLLHQLEQDESISKVFIIKGSIEEIGLVKGFYAVPIYEVRIDGFRVELNLAAVPIVLPSAQVINCDFVKFSRAINRGIQGDENTNDSHELKALLTDPNGFIDIGRLAIEEQMLNKIEELKAENTYRIEARINSMLQGSRVRTDKLNKKIHEHLKRASEEGVQPSSEFIRLTKAQIDNDIQGTEEKINKIKSKKELSLNTTLTAVCILHIE
jgi:superfamily II DNA or RNA helicase